MNFNANIAMDNAAFEAENAGSEMARILREMADHFEGFSQGAFVQGAGSFIRDVNGNKVGKWEIVGE